MMDFHYYLGMKMVLSENLYELGHIERFLYFENPKMAVFTISPSDMRSYPMPSSTRNPVILVV